MFTIGQKVTMKDGTNAEVVKVFKNGKVKIQFLVQTFGMVRPELWADTVKAESLSA